MLWILLVVLGGALAFNYYAIDRTVALDVRGASEEEARSVLQAAFDELADGFRSLLVPFVTLISVLVAPEARRNGTTQFLLSVPISRSQVAVGQFAALSGLLVAALLIAHLGMAYPGWRFGAVRGLEMALSWVPVLAVALAQALAVFLLSSTCSTVITLVIVLIAPWLFRLATETLLSLGNEGLTLPIRVCEHALFLFPQLDQLVIWPRLWPTLGGVDVPSASLALIALHEVCSIGFWSLLGVLLYRRFNFGSRTLLH